MIEDDRDASKGKPLSGLVRLTASAEREVEATSAKVRVTIAGQSYVYGNEALAKAAEVREFVASLRDGGIAEAAVEVVDVRIDQSSGKLTKGSRASYTLEVTCRPPAQLSTVFGCVAAAKTAEMGEATWHFGDLTPVRDEMAKACLDDVRARADRIAAGLGVPIVGVAMYTEQFHAPGEPAAPMPHLVGGGGMDRARRSAAPLDLGVATTHRARATFAVDATFRTGPARRGRVIWVPRVRTRTCAGRRRSAQVGVPTCGTRQVIGTAGIRDGQRFTLTPGRDRATLDDNRVDVGKLSARTNYRVYFDKD